MRGGKFLRGRQFALQWVLVNPEAAAISSWAFEPLPFAGLAVAAAVYLRGWGRLQRQAPLRFPLRRLVSFLAGLAAVGVAIASPLDAFASFLLSAHMVQHLLLTMVAPPLLLLGAPQLPLICGLPRRWASRGLGPFLQWPALKAFVHRLTHPAVCWALFVLSNVLWHFPDFYETALRSKGWHEFEHFCFLTTALLFWWHVVLPWPARTRWPRWAMVPYLLLADLQNTALAGVLSFAERELYPTYRDAPRIGMDVLKDQQAAGAIMWVPGSIAFLVPAAIIAFKLLSSPRRGWKPVASTASGKPAVKPVPSREHLSGGLDLLRLPFFGRLIRSRLFRRALQAMLFLLAGAVVIDGLLGPEISPMNLAGVLPWTHWRAFTVIALLAAGNLFCMACPFTLFRDLGRKFLPAKRPWPRALSTKWLAAGLIVLYLWAYEAFDLWDRPAATAVIILAYFAAALVIDGIFRGASFCKFVCPIGQFHFVQSLASPFEVRIRQPDVCASCRTFDCLKGNERQRGCETDLFLPRKSGNMDCTFCLDCTRACPHDNVGLVAVAPWSDLTRDPPRSSVGRFSRRPDLAVLVLVLTFGAFANAAGMVLPVLTFLREVSARFGLADDLAPVTVISLFALVLLPLTLAAAAAGWGRVFAGTSFQENFCRQAVALAPLGFGMWLAHFVFHLFTAALTPLPVFQRVANEIGLSTAPPSWTGASLAFYNLPALELLFLDGGLLLALFALWRTAGGIAPRGAFKAFIPWAALALALYGAGVWIVFQPMEMRGTMLH